METTILYSLAIIIISATIMIYIFNKLKQPAILAYIVTGVVIGPLLLGLVSNTEDIVLLSELGIAFLLFSVGIGTELDQLKKTNISILIIPVINIVLIFLFLFIFKNLMHINFIQSLYLAFIIGFSSTMLVAKIFMDAFEMSSIHARLAISILLVEDIIAAIVMPILENVSNLSLGLILIILLKAVALIAIALVLNRFIYPIVIKNTFKSEQGFFLLAVSSCFLFILISYYLKFSIAIGSFIGGLAISVFPYNLEINNKISGLRNLFAMIFFVSLGMQLSFNISSDSIVLLIILFIFILLLKPLFVFFSTLFSGYGPKVASKVSLSFAQVSEFSLILAIQGITLNHLTQNQYNAIVLVTSISMLITPYIMNYSDVFYSKLKFILSKFETKKFTRRIDALTNIKEELKDHIVVVGSDSVGEAIVRVIGRDMKIPLVVVDFNPEKINYLMKKKINCICGDINNEEVINAISLSKARLVIVTLPNFESTVRFLKTAKELHPTQIIFTRAKTKKEAIRLYDLGSDYVIIPEVLESNYIIEKINTFLKGGFESVRGLKSIYLGYLKNDQNERERK
ncbi:MAG: cation:proton antiporter [archaeon]